MELFDRETEAAEAEGCMEPNQIVRSWLFLHNGLGEARRKAWGGRLDVSRTTDHVAFLATTRLNEMGAVSVQNNLQFCGCGRSGTLPCIYGKGGWVSCRPILDGDQSFM